MAFYKYSRFLQQNNNKLFDEIYAPGQKTPSSGIYRCDGCVREVTVVAGSELPAQSHHNHDETQGSIRWRLIAYTANQ